MRTSLDLPDDLLREAKIAAEKRGVTLRELFTEALKHELNKPESIGPALQHVKFPIIPPSGHGVLRINPQMIEGVELEDDLRRGGFRSWFVTLPMSTSSWPSFIQNTNIETRPVDGWQASAHQVQLEFAGLRKWDPSAS